MISSFCKTNKTFYFCLFLFSSAFSLSENDQWVRTTPFNTRECIGSPSGPAVLYRQGVCIPLAQTSVQFICEDGVTVLQRWIAPNCDGPISNTSFILNHTCIGDFGLMIQQGIQIEECGLTTPETEQFLRDQSEFVQIMQFESEEACTRNEERPLFISTYNTEECIPDGLFLQNGIAGTSVQFDCEDDFLSADIFESSVNCGGISVQQSILRGSCESGARGQVKLTCSRRKPDPLDPVVLIFSIVAVVMFVLFLAAFVLGVFVWHTKKNRNGYQRIDESTICNNMAKLAIVGLEDIQIIEELGSGVANIAFTIMIHSRHILPDEYPRLIPAVLRKSKGAKNTQRHRDSRKELVIMLMMKPHINVITFFAECPENQGLIFEYCEKGSLDQFLLTSPLKLHEELIVKMLMEIARGLNHVHSQGILHRDLAARNILLTDVLVAKISDFDRSIILNDDQTEVKIIEKRTPTKWTAPEGLSEQIWSRESDVWSFGIVIIEILTRCEPNPYVTSSTYGKYFTQLHAQFGDQLPSHTPKYIAELFAKCTKMDRKERPSFAQIESILRSQKINTKTQKVFSCQYIPEPPKNIPKNLFKNIKLTPNASYNDNLNLDMNIKSDYNIGNNNNQNNNNNYNENNNYNSDNNNNNNDHNDHNSNNNSGHNSNNNSGHNSNNNSGHNSNNNSDHNNNNINNNNQNNPLNNNLNQNRLVNKNEYTRLLIQPDQTRPRAQSNQLSRPKTGSTKIPRQSVCLSGTKYKSPFAQSQAAPSRAMAHNNYSMNPQGHPLALSNVVPVSQARAPSQHQQVTAQQYRLMLQQKERQDRVQQQMYQKELQKHQIAEKLQQRLQKSHQQQLQEKQQVRQKLLQTKQQAQPQQVQPEEQEEGQQSHQLYDHDQQQNRSEQRGQLELRPRTFSRVQSGQVHQEDELPLADEDELLSEDVEHTLSEE